MNNLMKAVLTAAIAAAPFAAAHAQYTPEPQPYNPQDPQNYAAPAQQSYQQNSPQQQQNYPQPQQPYQQQPYAQQPQAQYPQQQPQDEAQYQAGQEAIAQVPPPLPQYDQPEAPGPGYIWTPGYWAWGPTGYYWVPGAWVEPPYQGALWTPGYWGDSDDGYYFWNAGYWGPVVGFYGGINYGFGYFGTGFYGGYWRGGIFFYNTAYWHCSRWGARYGYSQRYPGFVAGFHGGSASFVRHDVALRLPGGNSFGSHATIGAFRAGFGTRPGFGGYAGYRAQGFNGQQHSIPGNFNGNRAGGQFQGGQFQGGRPQGGQFQPHNTAPAQNHPAPRSAPAPAPHASGGGGGSHGGGGHR
jgi:hypothetical protein